MPRCSADQIYAGKFEKQIPAWDIFMDSNPQIISRDIFYNDSLSLDYLCSAVDWKKIIFWEIDCSINN